jgi:hypothetical protein
VFSTNIGRRLRLAARLTLAVVLSNTGEQVARAQYLPPPPAPIRPLEPPPPDDSDPSPDAEPPDEAVGLIVPRVAVHGFVSQGAFVSTANDYLGHSERGSFEFSEAAVNVSTEVVDRLRVGAQLFTRDLGPVGNYAMTLDWAYLDYRWREWLGLRAGRIKMPFGLYNEFTDIDSARLPILLPQSVYPIGGRDFLLAQTGFALHGSPALGDAGVLDYQVFAGTIFIGQSAVIDLDPAISIREIDTSYVAGGQVFWRTPLRGLRVGASYLRTNIAFHLRADGPTTQALRMAGLVPPDFDGTFEYGLRRINLGVGSLEYALGEWILSAEYSRWVYQLYSTVPDALPGSDENSERFYGMVSRRLNHWLEVGAHYSVLFVDPDDRGGDGMRFSSPDRAYQKDLALSARFDINDSWLWKLEGHYIDGTAELPAASNPDPEPRWGFFLVKTTVSF